MIHFTAESLDINQQESKHATYLVAMTCRLEKAIYSLDISL